MPSADHMPRERPQAARWDGDGDGDGDGDDDDDAAVGVQLYNC